MVLHPINGSFSLNRSSHSSRSHEQRVTSHDYSTFVYTPASQTHRDKFSGFNDELWMSNHRRSPAHDHNEFGRLSIDDVHPRNSVRSHSHVNHHRNLVDTYDDPAFSDDPALHPDFADVSDIYAGRYPSMSREDDAEDKPPPYNWLPPDDSSTNVGAGDPRVSDERSDGSLSSSNSWGEHSDVSERRRAYHVEDYPPHHHAHPDLDHPSPMSPESPLVAYLRDESPVDQQTPTFHLERPTLQQRRAPPVLAPSASRTVSDPLPMPASDRPELPRRGHTTSASQSRQDLDRIDELDESGLLLGRQMHHRGPYEFSDSVTTPPPRIIEIRPESFSFSNAHKVILDYPFEGPPPPIPYKIDLRPGDFLARAPSLSQAARVMYHNSPRQQALPDLTYTNGSQSNYGRIQTHLPDPHRHANGPPFPLEPANTSSPPPHNPILSPERPQIYAAHLLPPDHPPPPPSGPPVPSAHHRHRHSQRESPPSSNVSSVSVNPFKHSSTSSSDVSTATGRSHRQDQRQLELERRPNDGPESSGASIASSNPTPYSRQKGPPSTFELHRPKRLVMPAPLQTGVNSSSQGSTVSLNGIAKESTHKYGRSVDIPINENKRGNLLRKRTVSDQNFIKPEPSSPDRPQSGGLLASLFGGNSNSLEAVDRKIKGQQRRLSKRRH